MRRKPALAIAAATMMLSVVLVGTPSIAQEEHDAHPPSRSAEESVETFFENDLVQLDIVESSEDVPDYMLEPMANVIYCVLRVHHPHASHHVAGTINVESTTTCTGGAPASMRSATSINMGTKTRLGREANVAFKSRIDSNSAVGCNDWGPGTYRGGAYTSVTTPPGYVLTGPPMIHAAGVGKWLACGPQPTNLEHEAATVVEFSFIREDLAAEQ